MKIFFLYIIAVCFVFTGCKKETEDFTLAPISDYAPLVVGKYITYQLDSLVFQNFGTTKVVVSYQVKHEVSGEITDNLERPAYRITRFIRKTAAAAWVPDNSFMAVNTGNSLEFIENNMRFLKLKQPVQTGYTWKGNAFIDTYSFNSDVKYLADWDYTYDSVNVPLTLGAITLDSTIKVDQQDEVINNPDDPGFYSEVNYGAEKYAKGIGLVYRRFLHIEYQPPTPGNGGSYTDGSYGVTLTMIDHN
jgi:hypothetical protein